MSFFETLKKVTTSTITILESMAVSGDNNARSKVKKMSDKELKSYTERFNKSNRYIDEEIERRGL